MLPGEVCLGLTPLPGWEGSCDTAGSQHGHRQTPLPAPSAPSALIQNRNGFGKNPWEGCPELCSSLSPSVSAPCQVSSCAQRLPGRQQGVVQVEQKQQGGAEQANLAMSPCWPYDTTCRCWVCCQLRVPSTAPAQGAANSPARLALLPNLQ